MPAPKRRNPFYALLIPAGLLFSITACAYGYMSFVEVNSLRSEANRHADSSLFRWLNAHGTTALIVELAVLAVLTFAAIATDDWWAERGEPPQAATKTKTES
ncbi:MAG: hypothetical protein KDA44_09280 [Planctomycetales bacterium]|nr:hypothetical protein [Planctomycetales bacterium]